jgi:hypothetical protein
MLQRQGTLMQRTLRLAGIQLALAAMVLRALLPDGWMPVASGVAGIPIAICTANGPVQFVVAQDGRAGKHTPARDNTHHQDVCPFAGAPHFAVGAIGTFHTLPVAETYFALPVIAAIARNSAGRHAPQSPRAPPSFV